MLATLRKEQTEMNEKITTSHLERAAYVYIRQSTLQQVHQNVESSRRQYALEDRAREFGFETVIVVDEDLGVSGAGSQQRLGFSRLLAAVCNGEVGAVFALEASRLARNNRDWHHLIDLCVMTRTLVIDGDGIYDPRLLNDRLLLGLKGTMSEFELGLLRQRAQEAYRQKVLRGEVLTRVPIGYVRKGSTGIEMTPDRQIQEAIRGLFVRFESCGSLRQVLLWYHGEKMLFPVSRKRDGIDSVEWLLPNYQHLLRIMKNPTYAGAFAWGRTTTRSRVIDGRARKTLGHRIGMDQWQVLLKDHHEGYTSWDQYMDNVRRLASNRTKSHQSSSGAPRNGSALLAGLLRCARCGHKLHVGYRHGSRKAARYYCMTGNKEQGKPSCLSFGGVRVENAIVECVLDACQPLGIEASLQALEGGREEQNQKRKALEFALEKARFEAERARRQYDAADPENRLVAAELEARWNAALAQVAEIEIRLKEELQSKPSMSEQQRERLLTLGADLRALWDESSTTMELKKRVLRSVVNEVMVDVNHESGHIELKIHWAGGVHTPLRVRKNKVGRNRNATDPNVVELVRELAKGWRDSYIAGMLNRIGYVTGKGNCWNETRVKNLRRENDIPVRAKAEKRTWKTMSETAAELDVSMCVVRTMVKNGILPARQVAKYAPWMIECEDLKKSAVQSYAKQARAGKTAPFEDGTQTLNL
jgi:DNA invertase Pin-like site-specific DNA recombinase